MGDLKRIKPIFSEALGKQGPERRIFLGKACRQDPDLRAQAEALLKTHEGARDFLETPPFAGHITMGESSQTKVPARSLGRTSCLN